MQLGDAAGKLAAIEELNLGVIHATISRPTHLGTREERTSKAPVQEDIGLLKLLVLNQQGLLPLQCVEHALLADTCRRRGDDGGG